MLVKKQALLCVTLLFSVFCVDYLIAQNSLAGNKDVIYERWYRVELQGEAAGKSYTIQSREADQIVTKTELNVRISRGSDVMEIEMKSQFVETADGEPVSMWSMQKLAGEPIETSYKFTDDRLLIETKQGKQLTKRDMDLPHGNWFTPHEAEEFTQKRLKSGAKRIVLTTMDPLQGPESFRLERTIIDRDVKLEIGGKPIPAIHSEVSMSNSPGIVSTEYIDDKGVLIKGMTATGSLEFSFVLTDKKGASMNEGNAPEIMVSTFVKPTGSINKPRNATKLVVDLSVEKGEMAILPDTGIQKVAKKDDGSDAESGKGKVRVTIDTGNRKLLLDKDTTDTAVDKNPGQEVEEKYLANSVYLDHKSELIHKLVKRAVFGVGQGGTVTERAEAMRIFVNRYINQKGLDQGFATASEVASSRSGDCTEHGVLLAALFRADGIPARVVSGLLYVEEFSGARDIFGYHMWTQAYINGVWVDYDATLTQSNFDATHIAIHTSALEDGSVMNDFSVLVPLMGRLQINIIEVEYGK